MSISGIDIRGPVPDPYSELSLVAVASNKVIISRENLAFMDQDSNDDEVNLLYLLSLLWCGCYLFKVSITRFLLRYVFSTDVS